MDSLVSPTKHLRKKEFQLYTEPSRTTLKRREHVPLHSVRQHYVHTQSRKRNLETGVPPENDCELLTCEQVRSIKRDKLMRLSMLYLRKVKFLLLFSNHWIQFTILAE
jgi:hypothetical protein